MKAVFVIGPSGAGKTTLTRTLNSLHRQLFGKKSTVVVNLDCANECECDVDIFELATLQDIMEELELGPNGSLLYSIDLLAKNLNWLYENLEEQLVRRNPAFKVAHQQPPKTTQTTSSQLQTDNTLILFDLPGQIQLYLNHDSMRWVVNELVKRYRLASCVVQVYDSTYVYKVADFVSMGTMALSMVVNLEKLPHLILLNKIDLMKGRKPADGMLEDYLTMSSLEQMVQDHHDDPSSRMLSQFAKFVDKQGQVSFLPCSIYHPDLLNRVLFELEKIFGTLQNNLVGNGRFAAAVEECLGGLSAQKMIANLQAELFAEEEQMDFEEQLRKIREKNKK